MSIDLDNDSYEKSVAEQMVDGEACEGCGMPFEEAYGYPKRCTDCGGDGVTI